MSDSHRERLLHAARRCLETKGYARTTARDLVAASDTNLASIGYHFGSKEALLNQAISSAFVEWTEEVNRVVRETPADAPLERLLAGWSAMLDRIECNRPLIVAYLEATAQVARSEELRVSMASAYAECRARIADVVEESLEDGARQHAEVIAAFIIAVVDGITLQWMADPENAPGGDELAASLGHAFMGIVKQLSAGGRSRVAGGG